MPDLPDLSALGGMNGEAEQTGEPVQRTEEDGSPKPMVPAAIEQRS